MLQYCCLSILLLFMQLQVGNPIAIIAAKCKNGVVIASDTLSPGRKGSIISARNVPKLYFFNNNTVIAHVSGNSKFLKLYEDLVAVNSEFKLISGHDLDASAVANYARKLIYEEYNEAHIVIAGFSERDEQYVLWEILPGGSLMEADYVVAGRGGELVSTMLDDYYKRNTGDKEKTNPQLNESVWTMERQEKNITASVEETVSMIRKAIDSAVNIDLGSRGSKPIIWVLSEDNDESSDIQCV